LYNLKPTGEVVLSNIFQNGFSSIRKAAPPKELEPEQFLEEPEPYQTCPSFTKSPIPPVQITTRPTAPSSMQRGKKQQNTTPSLAIDFSLQI
jgi:hypothetical protein